MDRQKPSDRASREVRDQACQTCLYCRRESDDSQEHCIRFARFVDHVLIRASRDCDYWSSASSKKIV